MATFDRRAISIGAGALVLAVVLGAVGYLTGVSLATWKASLAGLDQIVMSSPKEPEGVARASALMFAWPAIVAGIAATIHHLRLGPPRPRTVALFFLIPAVALGAITMGVVMTVISTHSELQPMVTLASLGPGAEEAKVAAFVAAVMMLYVVVKRPT